MITSDVSNSKVTATHPRAFEIPLRSGARLSAWLVTALVALSTSLFYLHYSHVGLLAEEPRIGAHLARGDGFLSPLDDSKSAMPTSWSPPVYPALVSVVYRITGIATHRSIEILVGVNIVAFIVASVGIYELGRGVFGTSVGLAAGLLTACFPQFARQANCIWDDSVALALFVLLLVFAVFLRRRSSISMASMMLLGLALGVLALTKTSYVLAFPAIVSYSVIRHSRSRVRMFVGVGVVCLAFSTVLAPWTVRNYLVFNKLLPVRGGLSLELWLGNQPESSGWIDVTRHPGVDLRERAKLFDVGEIKYFEYCQARFKDNYNRDPMSFWRRCLRRIAFLFVGHLQSEAFAVPRMCFDAALTIVSLVGLFIAAINKWQVLWLFGIGALSVFPYILAQVAQPYAVPFRVILTIYGAKAIVACWKRLRTEAALLN